MENYHKNDYLDDTELLIHPSMSVSVVLTFLYWPYFILALLVPSYLYLNGHALLYSQAGDFTHVCGYQDSTKIYGIASSSESEQSTGHYLCNDSAVQTRIPLTEFAGIGHSNW